MQPIISILIPVYNRSALVIEAIQSVRAQTYPHWEVIVVDDHSTDETLAAIRGAFTNEPRVRVVSRAGEVRGAPACRNQALALATGEFVIFLDSDNVFAPWCLGQRVAYMEAHAKLDMAAFSVRVFHRRPGDSPFMFNMIEGDDDLDRFLKRDMPWDTLGPIWRRASLARVGPWDERLPSWQDWELHIRALCRGIRYHKLDQPDAYYRTHDEPSIGSTGGGARRYPHLLALLGRVGGMLDDAKLATPYRRSLLAANYFRLADAAILHEKEPARALPTWRAAYEHGRVGYLQYLQTGVLFRLHRSAALYSLGKRYLARQWPAYFAVASSKTHLQFRRPGDAAQASDRPATTASRLEVSVITPVFNAEHYVRDAVASVLAQPQVAELILIDDGSTDGTLDLCRALVKADPRVRLLQHADKGNHGISQTRNLGVRSACRDWVAFLDCDDYYLPGRFDAAERIVAEHPGIDGVYDAAFALPFGAPLPESISAEQLITLRGRPEPEKLFEWLLQNRGDWFHTSGIVLRRELLDRLGLFDTRLFTHEDTALWYKAAIVGRLMPGGLDRPIAVVRLRPGSITHAHSDKHYEGKYDFTLGLIAWALRAGVSRPRLELLYERHFAHVLQRMSRHSNRLAEKAHMFGMIARLAARDPHVLRSPALRRFLHEHSGAGRLIGKEVQPR